MRRRLRRRFGRTRRRGHSFGRVLCGEYHTRSGKTGAKVFRSVDRDGRTTYSWSGEWGAGSGHDLATMQREVNYWHERKRGMKVIVPFTP